MLQYLYMYLEYNEYKYWSPTSLRVLVLSENLMILAPFSSQSFGFVYLFCYSLYLAPSSPTRCADKKREVVFCENRFVLSGLYDTYLEYIER
jgi:hypothetical protein